MHEVHAGVLKNRKLVIVVWPTRSVVGAPGGIGGFIGGIV